MKCNSLSLLLDRHVLNSPFRKQKHIHSSLDKDLNIAQKTKRMQFGYINANEQWQIICAYTCDISKFSLISTFFSLVFLRALVLLKQKQYTSSDVIRRIIRATIQTKAKNQIQVFLSAVYSMQSPQSPSFLFMTLWYTQQPLRNESPSMIEFFLKSLPLTKKFQILFLPFFPSTTQF